MSNTITNVKATQDTIDFAHQYLRLQYDEQTNEFYSIYGQYAKPELVGTRHVVSEKEVLKKLDDCARNY
jgi:hypothetical protein